MIALDEMVTSVFPRPAVPAMGTPISMPAIVPVLMPLSPEWYFNKLGTAINAKPLLESPNSHSPIANMERCFIVTSVIRGKIISLVPPLNEVDVYRAEMEHWHAPYNYPRADHAQAWLLKCLEGAIARDADKESKWMFKQRCVSARIARMRGAHRPCSEAIKQTGRPEPTKPNLKLPRLSIPFGKKSTKAEWKEATLFELIPELEPKQSLSL